MLTFFLKDAANNNKSIYNVKKLINSNEHFFVEQKAKVGHFFAQTYIVTV